MAHWVHILHSRELDQYNGHSFRGAFTQKAPDWILRTILQCRDRIRARAIEGYIKKQKRRTFVGRTTLEFEFRNRPIEKFQRPYSLGRCPARGANKASAESRGFVLDFSNCSATRLFVP